MSENQQALEQAYQLIEAGQLGKARSILEGVLANNQNSADAWWLYAHAVEDPQQAIQALENVKRLDPTNDEASALLQTARQQVGDTTLSDDDFDIDLDDEEISSTPDDKAEDGRRRTFIIAGAIIGLVVLGIIILIASPRDSRDATEQRATTPEGTFISQGVNPTATLDSIQNVTPITAITTPDAVETVSTSAIVSTATPNVDTPIIPTNTVTVATQIIQEVSVDAFLASLSVNYPTNGTTEIVETVLGATLLVPMCTVRGDAHTQLIPTAMNGLSQNINQLPSDYVGVGVRFLDCSTNETINVMIVPSISALEYKNNDLSEQDFRRSWRVVDA